MSWLNPAGAWWLLLVPALIALYILRAQPQQRRVSSLRLWQELAGVDRPRARLRRPPLSWLLLLQVLLLTIGAMALIRPALTSPGGQQVVILLDASGSMGAQDGAGTRFDSARQAVRDLAGSLGPGSATTLVRVGAWVTTACAACTTADLGLALDALRPGAGRADWPAAFGVAAGLARRLGEGRVNTVVVSDGAFGPLALAAIPAVVRFIAVGRPVDNLGITVLSARRPPDARPGYTAFARISNAGSSAVAIEVSALADTVPLPSRQLTVPAGGQAELTWTLPPGTARLTLRLSPTDALPADNTAVLFLPTEGQHQVRLRTSRSELYRHVLSGIAGLSILSDTLDTGADLTIIEGRLPDPLPTGSLLLVHPDGAFLPTGDAISDVRPQALESTHPVLEGLDLGALLVQKMRPLTPLPPWLGPLVTSPGGPLVLAGEHDGRRIAVLTFDPRESNLPKLAAFPILLANLVAWLDPLVGEVALRPGAAVLLAPGTQVVTPTGQKRVVGAAGVFADTEDPGVYRVVRAPRGDLPFAVNMTDPQESSLAPRTHPELAGTATATADGPVSQQEVWPVLATVAVLLAGAEWFLYCWRRGQT